MLLGLWARPPQSRGGRRHHSLRAVARATTVPGGPERPGANTLWVEAPSPTLTPTMTLSARDLPRARPGTASDASAGLRLSQVSGKGGRRLVVLPGAEGHLRGPRLLMQMAAASEQRAPATPAFLTRGAGLGHCCLSLPDSGLEKGGGGNRRQGPAPPARPCWLSGAWLLIGQCGFCTQWTRSSSKRLGREADSNLLTF